MGRGRLRVLLGAAPGVGKTYTMLEEGRRLRAAGKDVVVALVETHDRAATAALVDGLDVLPRTRVNHRGIDLGELDVDAVIARRPTLALVDELAHSNAPGSRHDKRWRDVDDILAAGINVISTVNIQHIESLNDVVRQITGMQQRETIPDDVLRRADQIEVVDLAPQALRDRLAEGLVYPADRVDAALSNYFRLGNLTALRELALLWLADEVDVALQTYRSEQGIEDKWEARERVVVALSGGAEGDVLIRRGARIAARSSGGELLAVHITSADGLAEPNPGALAAQRTLVESLSGSYHQVVGDDTATALVDFARGVNATQLVIGASRRSRLTTFLTGQGNGEAVIRQSGDIDVHIVTHQAAGRIILPVTRGALSMRRRLAGAAVALLGVPALTAILSRYRSDESMSSDVLWFQLLVVIVALVGGIWPAVASALLSGFALNFFFVAPLYTATIDDPRQAVTLFIFVAVAMLVSVVVDQAARRTRMARRSAVEAETLATVAGSVIRGESAIEALVGSMREAFGMDRVALDYRGVEVFASTSGAPGTGKATDQRTGTGIDPGTDTEQPPTPGPTDVAVGPESMLHLTGRPLLASDRRILAAFIAQLEAALEQRELRDAARSVKPLEESDRLRTALLAAVGHDLRTPLSSATAAVSSLRSTDVDWSDSDRDELLATAEESLHRLADLVGNLLDSSRLQAGVLAVALADAGVDEVVAVALDEIGGAADGVRVDVPADLPAVHTDPVLLQRVLVNLVGNALRYSPAGTPPSIMASAFGGRVEVRVTDRGPGIPADRLPAAFQPFQRLGDTDNSTGVGLGLALSTGFLEAVGGTLTAEETPGGGLTMVISLPAARDTGGLPTDMRDEPNELPLPGTPIRDAVEDRR
ncbi:DUF4118 domain-containing protein [Marisediminicola senii]|uniref:DUF4118 domain-containing protein n=1 Tax=Marisediminicola senii TaxID=2711233 RepID=UPI0013EA9AB3|nr:DUF4118 domain-containing protein [Marisediminicola senii]